MKNSKKIIVLLVSILMVTAYLTGCGSASSEKAEKSGAESVKIEDIDWKVDEGITDGKRKVLLNYTNNTPFTIVEFNMQFKQKDKIKDEEKAKFYEDIKGILKIDENDAGDAENFEKLKSQDISMHAESEVLVKSKESAPAIACEYYKGSYDVADINHYSLVTPDILTLKYIDNAEVKTLYYDFSSKKYTTDSKTEKAFYWTDKGLEKVLPKPEAEYVTSTTDSSDLFSFDVYGWKIDNFNSYVNQCKEKGFTAESSEHEGYYTASDANGYSITFFYDEDEFSMGGHIEKSAS